MIAILASFMQWDRPCLNCSDKVESGKKKLLFWLQIFFFLNKHKEQPTSNVSLELSILTDFRYYKDLKAFDDYYRLYSIRKLNVSFVSEQ